MKAIPLKKACFVLAVALILATAGYLMASANNGSPQGGYVIWHQTGGHGQYVTVDQPGCLVHLASHPNDYEVSPDLYGDCGSPE
jgi:hypothetical protein